MHLAGHPEAWTVEPLWRGQRAYVIAGGQSVPRSFLAAHRLPGRVLAIKDAVLAYPYADCLFWADPHDFHKQRPEVYDGWRGALTVKRAVHNGIPAHVKQVRRMFTDKRKAGRVQGLSLDPSMLGGWDSGGSALNLAFHLGAAEIVLIGYDLQGRHWNPAHPFPNASMRTHALHAASIDAMAAPIAAAGVKVWNTSPCSSLKEYRYAHLAGLV